MRCNIINSCSSSFHLICSIVSTHVSWTMYCSLIIAANFHLHWQLTYQFLRWENFHLLPRCVEIDNSAGDLGHFICVDLWFLPFFYYPTGMEPFELCCSDKICVLKFTTFKIKIVNQILKSIKFLGPYGCLCQCYYDNPLSITMPCLTKSRWVPNTKCIYGPRWNSDEHEDLTVVDNIWRLYWMPRI